VTEKRTALGAELVIPLLALGFTLYFLYSTSALQWEAKANGVIMGTALIVLVAGQLLRIGFDLARGRGGLGFGELTSPPEAFRKRVGIIAVTVLLVAGLPWLGLSLGLFLAFAAGFTIMGVRPAKRVLLVSFAIAAVCSVMFTAGLDIGLPRGPVENLFHHFLG
jgi:hypothetical protein